MYNGGPTIVKGGAAELPFVACSIERTGLDVLYGSVYDLDGLLR